MGVSGVEFGGSDIVNATVTGGSNLRLTTKNQSKDGLQNMVVNMLKEQVKKRKRY